MLNSTLRLISKQDSSTREGDGMLPKFRPLLSLAAQWRSLLGEEFSVQCVFVHKVVQCGI